MNAPRTTHRTRRHWAARVVAALRAERGSVAAEFAVTLPAVALVLVASITCVQLGSVQLRLQDAAGAAARSLARGEPRPQAFAAATALVPGASVTSRAGSAAAIVCVTAARSGGGALVALTLTATSCAIGGGL